MTWTVEQGYDFYPQIEEEFNASLAESLNPAGPDQLYDFVAELGLPAGSSALDLGCGEGNHTLELVRRFGFTVIGVDPVQRHLDIASAKAQDGPTFRLGRAEAIPADDES